MACRTGCPTQDCKSYHACLRGARVRVAYTNSANGWDASNQKRWDSELTRYQQLVKSGVQPPGTQHKDMDKAERLAEQGRHEPTSVPLSKD